MKLNCVAFAGAIAISFAFWVFTVDAQASERREELWLEASRVPAVAAEAPGHGNGMHLCSIHAYLRKSATGGAKLRAGPGTHTRIVARIPVANPEDDMQPEFQIIGSKNGWLLIHNPHWADYGSGEKLLFKGSAWIAPGLIDFEMEGYTLFSAPRIKASVLLRLKSPGKDWDSRKVTVEQVRGCSGSFLDMTIRLPHGKRARGWFAAICGNQATTCTFGDDPAKVEERRGKLVGSADLN
ncbi:hypothetical protein [Microvirga lotononidis]|uniref:SH3 domain-containing protein n=1 Tax=Microvirga lotononidis TaxID=864069 RepID=I4Z086_9HYPH|nr:hypothetical protein [Microvirga lotononidis]EIM29628.1 hypothetical protein MicloDRAFT_00021090 [Microvirga lotononidis]WQO27069.1 hypothetical protein U0023_20820 [Microvirga lotononidis]